MHLLMWMLHDGSPDLALEGYSGEIDYESLNSDLALSEEEINKKCLIGFLNAIKEGNIHIIKSIDNLESLFYTCNLEQTEKGVFDLNDIVYEPYLYDWYVIGGRWHNSLPILKGMHKSPYNSYAEMPWAMEKKEKDIRSMCNSSLIKNVDWGRIKYPPAYLFYEGDGEYCLEDSLFSLEELEQQVVDSGYKYITVVDVHQ